IYELLRTDRLDAQLQHTELTPRFAEIPKGDSPHVLGRHIADAVTRALEDIAEPEARRELANRVLADLGATDERIPSLEQLLGLSSSHQPLPRPVTPLSDVALLTNARGEPNMASEVAQELASADTVDLLCAFIRFAGISVLAPQLAQLRDRGVQLR